MKKSFADAPDVYKELEEQLGVREAYDQANWNTSPNHCVYVIHDRGEPKYYGISNNPDRRLRQHLSSPKSPCFSLLNSLVSADRPLEDFMFVLHRNITQRQAAILELNLIYTFRGPNLLNSRSIWLPDFMDEGTRRAQSSTFQGRIMSPEAILKSKLSKTNTLQFDLFHNGVFVKTFHSISRRDLAKWITMELGIDVPDPSSLWRVVSGRRKQYKGLTVSIHCGQNNLHHCDIELTELKRALPLRPFVVRYPDGSYKAMVGNTAEARARLNLSTYTVESLLSKKVTHSDGVTARYLTDNEVDRNLKGMRYPAFYNYSVDNSQNELASSLSLICKLTGASSLTLSKGLESGEPVFSNGKMFTINLVVRSMSLEISNVVLDHSLPSVSELVAQQRTSPKQSDVPGVSWAKTGSGPNNRRVWCVLKSIGGRKVKFKQTQERKVAEDIARYIDSLRNDLPPEEIIEKGRLYAKSYKKKNGIMFRT